MRLALGLLVALGVAGVLAPAAFAHSSGLSVSAVCNTATGNYDVTWTVGPTDVLERSPRITASNNAAIPVGTALTTPTKTFTQSVPGTTTSVTASITVTWSDNFTQSYTKTLPLGGPCAKDQGYLKVSKVFDAKASGFTGTFAIKVKCGSAAEQPVSLHGGESTTLGPFDVGTQCTVSEPVLPAAPSGWTFGTPAVSGSPAAITKGTQATAVVVTVTNTITQNAPPPESTPPPPPPPPPPPKADITVTKTATPAVTLPLGGGTAPITYSMVVSNLGPDAAANVKVADAAPVSVSFASATTSAGSCTTTPTSLDCSLGTMAAGASVTITVNATVNATGTKVNVVTVTTTTTETNSGNNQAQAQTVVTAPAIPPAPPAAKPKPKPAPVICTTVIAAPKTLKANGKTQKIRLEVTQGTKGITGAKIRVTGPGVTKTVRTGRNGLVVVSFTPSKPGIVRVQLVGAKACNSQRLGVVGVFEPPLTG